MRMMIAAMASALFSGAAFLSSPAQVEVPAGTCGPAPLSRQGPFSLLTGDACQTGCDKTDWKKICAAKCCPAGTPYPPPRWEACDDRCQAHCEYDSWGDCYYTWCNADVLFCASVPIHMDDLAGCLRYLCQESIRVDNATCH